jgi:hypothetical protein
LVVVVVAPNKRMEDPELMEVAVDIMLQESIPVARVQPVVLTAETMGSPDLQVLAAAAAVAQRV